MITRKVKLAFINLFVAFSSLLLEQCDQEFDNTKIFVTSLIQVKLFRKIKVILHVQMT